MASGRPRARPGTYAFDRLPSQQAQPESQQRLEDAAHQALAALGFTAAPAGATPDVLVQLGARVTRYDSAPWADPWWWRGALLVRRTLGPSVDRSVLPVPLLVGLRLRLRLPHLL